ncbi:MAG: hypothetical protein V1918_04675, partial [Planctomycetota bacterium]
AEAVQQGRLADAGGEDGAEGTPPAVRAPADAREAAILSALGPEPVHIDALCAETGLAVSAVSSALMMLELKRRVDQLPGRFFVKKTR